jgi:hypothetical protein
MARGDDELGAFQASTELLDRLFHDVLLQSILTGDPGPFFEFGQAVSNFGREKVADDLRYRALGEMVAGRPPSRLEDLAKAIGYRGDPRKLQRMAKEISLALKRGAPKKTSHPSGQN